MSVDLSKDRFEGALAIALRLEESRSEIQLHAIDLEVANASVELGDRTIDGLPRVDAESETVTLTFAEPVPAGLATLRLQFRGAFSSGLEGLYRSGSLALTSFEPANARRLFPCFDEPAFKAIWELTLRGVPAGAVALSNGAVIRDEADSRGGRRVTFAPTPPLSSYLVAIILGDLVASDVVSSCDVPIRTWTLPAKRHLTAFAQGAASAVLPLLEDYFGLPYPFGKLDQIGIPDFEAGAMENAGAVTFREVSLLLDEATAPLSIQKRVAEVITHELAHQWFGNLVTMVWWDDLWLNEAFATWMAYRTVALWRPEWHFWLDFESGKGRAMLLDSLRATHPIRADVSNAEEAGESFDAITYEKGGAVLRMIEAFLGEERFREGIRLYMKTHQEKNATADDLWSALSQASGQPIVELANGWIRQGGYPVINLALDAEAKAVSLEQRRFFSDPEAHEDGEPTRWSVPIVLRYQDDEGVKEQAVLLDGARSTVSLEARGPVSWCLGNADARGFFRVAYDDETMARLVSGLATSLRPSERLGLVSDQWALVGAGVVPIESFLALVVTLRDEEDPVVLSDLVARLTTIEHRFLEAKDRPAFGAFVTELFGARAAPLEWSSVPGAPEDDASRLRRAALLRAVVLLAREPQAVAEAKRWLPSFPSEAEDSDLDPNLLDIVVTAAARGADLPLFEELRRRSREEPDPAAKRRYLNALAAVEDTTLVDRAVELSLGEDVPMQDFTSFFGVLLSNPATRDAAWHLIRTQFEDVRARSDSPVLLRHLFETLAALPERRHLDEITEFLAGHPIDGAKQATAQTLERLRIDANLRDRLMPAIAAWLKTRRTAEPMPALTNTAVERPRRHAPRP